MTTSTLASPDRRMLAVRAASVAALATALLPTALDPSAQGPVLCPLRRFTGMPCPGCGLTRAAAWLGRGDLSASWRLHPFAIVIGVQVVTLAVLAVARWPHMDRRRPVAPSTRTALGALAAANAAAMLAFWLVRMKTGALDAVR